MNGDRLGTFEALGRRGVAHDSVHDTLHDTLHDDGLLGRNAIHWGKKHGFFFGSGFFGLLRCLYYLNYYQLLINRKKKSKKEKKKRIKDRFCFLFKKMFFLFLVFLLAFSGGWPQWFLGNPLWIFSFEASKTLKTFEEPKRWPVNGGRATAVGYQRKRARSFPKRPQKTELGRKKAREARKSSCKKKLQ